MPLDELYPPYQYGWGWLWLAFGLILAVVIGALLVRHFTRPRRIPDAEREHRPELAGDVVMQLRTEYHREIDRIMHDHSMRRITGHQANQRLSTLVRRYVNEYSGIEAPVLALSDLKSMGVNPVLVDAIQRHYYPSIFRRNNVVDPRAGADAARKVVEAWH